MLRKIERISQSGPPRVVDPDEAAKVVVYMGTGVAYALMQLGLISSAEWRGWTPRFLDAAGIAHEWVEGSVSWSFTVEADGPVDEPDTEHP